jgi:hypothetical protein
LFVSKLNLGFHHSVDEFGDFLMLLLHLLLESGVMLKCV